MYKVVRHALPFWELPHACTQLLPVMDVLAIHTLCKRACTEAPTLAAREHAAAAPGAVQRFCLRLSPLDHARAGSSHGFTSLPSHTTMGMPALSPTMTQGNVVKWYVEEGQEVSPGIVLADIETDKATLAFENQEEGFIAKILVPAGSRDIPVGAPLAILVDEAADVASFANYSEGGAAAPSAQAEQASAPLPAADAAPAPSTGSGKKYPAHSIMSMPALSPTMEQGNVVTWHIKEGTAVQPGDVLADIETDKATLGFENQEEGVIAKILVPAGSKDIKVGSPLAILVDEESLVPEFTDFSLDNTAAAAPAGPSPPSPSPPSAEPAAPHKPPSSKLGPAARKLLAEAGLTPDDVAPTGPHRIVTKGDVLAAIAAGVKHGSHSAAASPPPPPPAAAPAAPASTPSPPKPSKPSPPAATTPPAPPAAPGTYTDIPTTQIRRIIATRLLESKRTIPSMYVTYDADMDALMQLRKTLQAQGTKLSVNDFVVRAVALALRDAAGANVFWNTAKEQVEPLANVDVAVAVATPTGLITPVVRDADKKSISQISKEVKDLAARARDNKLKPEEFTGGSFTISNLGMYGIKQFSAIINPPQAAILAVGGGRSVSYITDDGKLKSKNVMSVTLSADNRAYDEEVAAKVLETFGAYMANPLKLVL